MATSIAATGAVEPLRVPSTSHTEDDADKLRRSGRAFSGMSASTSRALLPARQQQQHAASNYVQEAVGTFFLVLVVSLAGGVAGPLAVGGVLMAMVFAGGHLSGALYNPAVTLAAVLRGEVQPAVGLGFAVVQVVSGIAAGFAGHALNDGSVLHADPIPGPNHGHSVGQAFVAELCWSFALCFVVLSVATVAESNHHFGLSIGFTVGAGALLTSTISGAVFNPAVGTGLIVSGAAYAGASAHASNLWIYWVAPLLAAVLAAAAFRVTNYKEFQKDDISGVRDDTATKCGGPGVAACVMEIIGTFFLVLAVSLSSTNLFLGAVGIGTTLMAMVFAGGHVSGAMYNPAVTLAIWLRGGINGMTFVVYSILQVLAAFAAAAVGYYLTSAAGAPGPGFGHSVTQAFFAEVAFTFGLALVVLNVATTKSQEDNSHFGLAIGFIVLAGAVAAGPISGGVFNPAVGTGLTLVGAIVHGGHQMKYIWLYWLAPLIGGALAAAVFRFTNMREYEAKDGKGERVPLVSSASGDGRPIDAAVRTEV